MTRIAFVTDDHFDASSRFEETIRLHDWIAEDAAGRGCTLTLLGGDLHERKSVAEERNAVAAWLTKMAQLGPVVGVYGNHDNTFDLDLYGQLEAEHPVAFHSSPCVVLQGGVAIACVPWPRRSFLATAASAAGLDTDDLGRTAMQDILRGLGAELGETNLPRVFLGHVQMRGSLTSTGQPLVGVPMELGLEDLALCPAQFYALGHIHLGPGNEWRIDGAPVAYGGSPRRTSFGESEVKSYTVIEFDGSRLVGWERIATPATPMHLLEASFIPADGEQRASLVFEGTGPGDEMKGAEVRLRIKVAVDHREAAKRASREWAERLREAGAGSVKIEEIVQATVRARAPEIARAVSVREKLDALWLHRHLLVTADRRRTLLEKLGTLEESNAV